MNSEWIEWDPSLDVNSSEDVAAFLNAVLELGDPAILPDALGVIARSRGMKAIAEETGLGRESLYKSLSKSGNPRFTLGAGKRPLSFHRRHRSLPYRRQYVKTSLRIGRLEGCFLPRPDMDRYTPDTAG